MNSINAPQFSRNYGFWNEAEQKAIMDSRVAIAGVGGDGFQMGLKLAQMGVATFDIADPEVFEPQNTNRVPGATVPNYGRKKAEVFKERVLEINPDADVRVYNDGLHEDNLEDFLSRATLCLDESELTYLHIGTMLAREARRRGVPNILAMNIGFASQVTSFEPESKMTFEKFMGLPEGMPLDEVKEQTVDFSRCLVYLPKYGDLETLKAVQDGASLPSITQGVDIASGLGSTQALLHMTRGINNNRPKPVTAPRVAYIDAYDLSSGVTSLPRASYYRRAAHMAVRSLIGLNPKTSYTDGDRARRDEAYASEQQ